MDQGRTAGRHGTDHGPKLQIFRYRGGHVLEWPEGTSRGAIALCWGKWRVIMGYSPALAAEFATECY